MATAVAVYFYMHMVPSTDTISDCYYYGHEIMTIAVMLIITVCIRGAYGSWQFSPLAYIYR